MSIAVLKMDLFSGLLMSDIEIKNILVYAHTFPQESFSSGVLGLNVLSLFDVNMLFSKNLIELKEISNQSLR